MRRAVWMAAAFILCGAAGEAADREFSDVVRAIGDEYHVRPVRPPLFSFVNAFAAAAHPGGTNHIELAVFEHLVSSDQSFPDRIRRAVGASWTPFIQIRSDRDHETVFVYLRQIGRDWKLLVVTMERAETAVMQLTLDADGLSHWLSDPERRARHWENQ